MAGRIAIFTALAVLRVATPAFAQRPADDVRGVLTDLFGSARTVRGQVVQHRAATLVLRGEDDRIYAINTAGLDTTALARLKEGRPVTIALTSGSPGAMPIATAVEAIEIQPSATVASEAHQRVRGSIETVGLGSLTMKTDRGHALTVDTTQVSEPVRVRPGDLVTIVGKMAEGHSERFVAEVIRND